MSTSAPYRSAEYAERGEYHRHLDPNWSYYPIYVDSTQRVLDALVRLLPDRSAPILDVGAGEGVLVERIKTLGYSDVKGMDLNYAGKGVSKGDITRMEFPDASFDCVICLSVLEHLGFSEQEAAVREMYRILRPGGWAVIAVPNLAHLGSRLKFFLLGKLSRTSDIKRHIGDRPAGEYLQLFKGAGFSLKERKGFMLTIPFLYRLVSGRPKGFLRMYSLLKPLAVPSLSFVNLFILRK